MFESGLTRIREFSEVYLHMVQDGVCTLVPNTLELSAIAAVPFAEGCELLTESRHSLKIDAIRVNRRGRKKDTMSITADSFVPAALDYYARVLEVGELFAGGINDLAL